MHTRPSALSSPPASDVRETVGSLLASVSHYVDARWRIASLEAREAMRTSAGMLALGAVILLCVTVAYTGLMVALTWWFASMWQIGEGAAVAILVVGHLLLAAVCAGWLAHTVCNRRLFHATRKEFMEDKRWLESHHPSRN